MLALRALVPTFVLGLGQASPLSERLHRVDGSRAKASMAGRAEFSARAGGRVSAAKASGSACGSSSLMMSGWSSRVMLGLIRGYRAAVSPLFAPRCRFLPTCSDYAAQAIIAHGSCCGLKLAAFRIARCHPWGGSGIDEVPDRPHCTMCGRLSAVLQSLRKSS